MPEIKLQKRLPNLSKQEEAIFTEAIAEAYQRGKADAASHIVHCDSCKHSDVISCPVGRVWCNHLTKYAKKDWFCADGERKSNER